MKNIPVLLIFIFIGIMSPTIPAQAFFPPYPYVLSQPIDILPQGSITISVGDEVYYYCNGVFYQKIMRNQKYAVVPPPIGGVILTIPNGYQFISIDGFIYYEYGGVFYKRVLEGYEVVFPPI